MRIDPPLFPTGAAAAAAASRPRPSSPGATFEPGPGATARGGAARSAAPLATMDAILALQGEDDPTERRRRSAKRGREILDALDGLKAALLSGTVPAADLSRLAAGLAARAERSGDPTLDGIVSAIELRARVELAKLGRADA